MWARAQQTGTVGRLLGEGAYDAAAMMHAEGIRCRRRILSSLNGSTVADKGFVPQGARRLAKGEGTFVRECLLLGKCSRLA